MVSYTCTLVAFPTDTGEPGSSGGGGGGGGGFRPRNFSTTSLSMDEQVEILQEQLELAQAQYTGTTKRTRVKSLKRELVSVRRQQKNQQKKARNSGGCELILCQLSFYWDQFY